MLGPTHSWTPHSVGPWQYLGCSDDTYYLYIVVIRMAYCTCREKYYLFLCYFLQPKSVMWTTRKQDFQDSRKVHCNWNHLFLLTCQVKKGLVLNKISTFFVFLSKIPLLCCPLIVYFAHHFIRKSSFFPYNCWFEIDFQWNTRIKNVYKSIEKFLIPYYYLFLIFSCFSYI